MTLFQLRAQLAQLSDLPDSTQVVTRGSAPTTMVDAVVLRVVNTTAKRKVLFIGKPKAAKSE